MHLAGAAAVGGGGDDVLRCGRLTGGLLVQTFVLVLGGGLRAHLLRLQVALTLGDNIVCLTGRRTAVTINTRILGVKKQIYQSGGIKIK